MGKFIIATYCLLITDATLAYYGTGVFFKLFLY